MHSGTNVEFPSVLFRDLHGMKNDQDGHVGDHHGPGGDHHGPGGDHHGHGGDHHGEALDRCKGVVMDAATENEEGIPYFFKGKLSHHEQFWMGLLSEYR